MIYHVSDIEGKADCTPDINLPPSGDCALIAQGCSGQQTPAGQDLDPFYEYLAPVIGIHKIDDISSVRRHQHFFPARFQQSRR